MSQAQGLSFAIQTRRLVDVHVYMLISNMSGEGLSSQDMYHHPGQYQFTIHPGLQYDNDRNQPIQKSVEFIFSTKLNCLYVKKNAVCPFGIFTSDTPPPDSQIKILVYSEDNLPVMRCRAHTEGNDNEDFISPFHYMRCESNLAVYDCCAETGQLSILLPYIKPESVAENVENLIFLCSTKHCIKKALYIKFSLINRDQILGYHVFGIHVCSTPGRDCLNHEAGKKRKRKMPAGSDVPTEITLPPSQQAFKIVIKKPWIREYMKKVNRGLELLEAVPYEDQERYLRRHRAKQGTSSHSTCTITSSSSDTRSTLRRILVRS